MTQLSDTRILAVADLVQGTQGLYTFGVVILALLFLLAGGAAGWPPSAGQDRICARLGGRWRHLRRRHRQLLRHLRVGQADRRHPHRRHLRAVRLTMSDNAQLFTGVHDTPVYTNIVFDKPLRVWVAVPGIVGSVTTALLTVLNLNSGHALGILIGGVFLTALFTLLGALVPRTRPSMIFRLRALKASVRPRVHTSADTAILARPTLVDNLWFGGDGSVYAGFLLAGLPYHLQSTRRKTGVADLHMLLGRELPADSWIYGLGVAQDQRQLLRAMVHGYRDRTDWVASCAQVADQLAEEAPKTRLYWLMVPVDSGRAGHNVVGQATKLKDWVAGRDKDSDSSLRAYSELAYDIANSLPPEFAPVPVTPAMSAWFWRHNAWLGTYSDPLPRRRPVGTVDIRPDQLPIAAFDEGDQKHRPLRPSIFNALPSWKKYMRVSATEGAGWSPDSYQAILPVVDAPEGGIVFPGSNSSLPSTISTPERCSTSPSI